jgi:DNA-binding beta-propeller fold protein YncE
VVAVLVLCALTNLPASANDFKFERMWPTLPQPWYFAPGGAATDADGFLYITNTTLHKVTKLAPDGRLVSEWGSVGGAHGQFVQQRWRRLLTH